MMRMMMEFLRRKMLWMDLKLKIYVLSPAISTNTQHLDSHLLLPQLKKLPAKRIQAGLYSNLVE